MKKLAVVMLTYNRPERLRKTLAMLEAQTHDDFTLYLVNNNPAIAERVAGAVDDSSLDIRPQYNTRNMGCNAKNQKAHECAVEGHEFVVMVDDDIDFGPTMLQQFAMQARPDAVIGATGWVFRGDYWDRTPVDVGGEAHYIPGGYTVIPDTVLLDPKVARLDEQYWPADDLWRSYVANHIHGLSLIRGAIDDVSIDVDGKDHYVDHIQMKRNFLSELRATGWKV